MLNGVVLCVAQKKEGKMTKVLKYIYQGCGTVVIILFGIMSGVNLLQKAWGSMCMNLALTALYIALYVLMAKMGWK